MSTLIPLSRRRLTIWLAAVFSPTGYFFFLLLADRFQVPSPPESLVAALFYLIPPSALLVGGSVVWSAGMTTARKVGWLLLTLVAILIQVGVTLALIMMAIAATGYAQ